MPTKSDLMDADAAISQAMENLKAARKSIKVAVAYSERRGTSMIDFPLIDPVKNQVSAAIGWLRSLY